MGLQLLEFHDLLGSPHRVDFLGVDSEVTASHFRLVSVDVLFVVVDRVHNGLSLRVAVAVLACFVKCALLQFVDVL
jgi:hypothetical protein